MADNPPVSGPDNPHPPQPRPPPAPRPQTQPDPSSADSPPAAPPALAPARRIRRRWPWVIGWVFIVLLVLVLLLPTILSMAWARTLIVDHINQRINGHARIQDWSVGWWSGGRIDGLVIDDPSNRRILQLPRLQTNVRFWDILIGHYDLGKTEVNRLDVLVSREPDGSLNWAHLVRTDSSPGAPSAAAAAQHRPNSVPDIRGNLVLNNCTVTYEDPASGAAPVYLRSVQGAMAIQMDPRNGHIHLRPKINVRNLEIGGWPYPESDIQVAGDLLYATATNDLDIAGLAIHAAATHAVDLVVHGRVDDLAGAQEIHHGLTADIGYDAGALWKLIFPFLSKSAQDKLRGARFAGKYRERFEFRGAYPSGQTFGAAIQKLWAQGEIQLAVFDAQGVTLKQVDVPVRLKDGILQIASPVGASTRPSPRTAYCNGGTLDIEGCAIDLRGPHPLLIMPRGLQLMQGAALNPVFAAWSLGSVLDNPLFARATQAGGVLNVTIDHCDHLPLDCAITGRNDGDAALHLSIMGLRVANPFLQQLADAAKLDINGFRGDVKDYRVTISNGIVHQDFTMTLVRQRRLLHLAGDVRESTGELQGFQLDLPLKDLALHPRKSVGAFLPGTITIPLSGTVDHPMFDLGKSSRTPHAGH